MMFDCVFCGCVCLCVCVRSQGVVLRQSAEYLYLTLKIAAAGLVCIAAIVYIRKQ